MSSALDDLLQQHQNLFHDQLGTLKGFHARLAVDLTAQPCFFKPRPVPYVLKEKVEKELEPLQGLGIIKPVSFSDWAAPIVPVVKSDTNIRICGDYKVTINQASQTDSYPLPHVDDLFAALSGGTIFTKLDLSHAYQQILLDEDSKNLRRSTHTKDYSSIRDYLLAFPLHQLCFNVPWKVSSKDYQKYVFILMIFWLQVWMKRIIYIT